MALQVGITIKTVFMDYDRLDQIAADAHGGGGGRRAGVLSSRERPYVALTAIGATFWLR